MFRQVKGV